MVALTTGMGVKTGGTHNAMTKKDAKCFNFDGVDEYVDTGISGNELMVNDEITIAAWVRLTSGQTASQFICGGEEGPVDAIYFYVSSSGYVVFFCSSDTGDETGGVPVAQVSAGDTGWFFAAGKLDNDLGYSSLNGSDWRNTVDNGFVNGDFSANEDMFIGSKNDDGTAENFLEGKISSVMFFNKALSQEELNDLYSGGRLGEIHPKYAGVDSNLLARYRMGDEASDTNTVLVDASGNGNTGAVESMESGDLVVDSQA